MDFVKQQGSEAIAVQANVRELEDVRRLFQTTLDHFGQVDILINNAAGKNIFKPTAQMTVEDAEQ